MIKMKTIPVSKIYYTEDIISSYFNDGVLVKEKDPSDIKILAVFYEESKDKYWTINNRSLFVLKYNSISSILCYIKLKSQNEYEFQSLLKTRNEGIYVNIKQNEGVWEKEYFLLKSQNPNLNISLDQWIESKMLNRKNRKSKSFSTIEFTDFGITKYINDTSEKDPFDVLKFFPERKRILVSNIYFLQEYISSYFHDGTPINLKDPNDINSIEVLYDEETGKYWSINNRSLYVLKANNIKCVNCVVNNKKYNEDIFSKRFTTKNGGVSIKILNNYQIIEDEFASLLATNLKVNIKKEEFVKHKIRTKNQIIPRINNEDNTFLKKKRANRNDILDIFKYI